uniref:C-type lectin domain-containing protein n=1 Tax=Laticauda laticaudata TaxID=8630 RepID=A0A8C5SW76_LATLA
AWTADKRCTQVGSLIVLTDFIFVSVKKTKSHPCSPPFASQDIACPDAWIGYLRKCFYVSKEERNWSLSLEICSSFNASLAVIDTQNELHYEAVYKSKCYCYSQNCGLCSIQHSHDCDFQCSLSACHKQSQWGSKQEVGNCSYHHCFLHTHGHFD